MFSRKKIAERLNALRSEQTDLLGELETIAGDEARSLDDEQAARGDEIVARLKTIGDEVDSLSARDAELAAIEERAARAADVPQVMKRVEVEAADVRSLGRTQARDMALKVLEQRDSTRHLDTAQVDKVDRLVRQFDPNTNGAWIAKRLLVTESDAYRSAFMKGVTQAVPAFTSDEVRALEEFRAMSIGVDTAGGFGVPVLIDPSIILTAQGSLNPFRRIARVITITTDEWKGVSSTGVSWSIDAEATAVSNDAPTLAQPTVTTGTARGFIPYSIEVGMDYPSFAQEMSTLLMEGYDELQASHFATGSTSSTNRGIITALDANTNVEVTPTTDGAFGAVDINKVWGALADRYKGNATWVMNHDVGNEVSSFSTSGMGSFYTVNLSQGNAPQLKGRPVEFSSYFPDFTGTTGASNILVVGDFRNYVIVDRAGMNVELVPHLFDVTNNRPTGQRGWFAWARFGGNSVNDLGFRLLQNQ